jgi:type IV pilus assembly protein PilN
MKQKGEDLLELQGLAESNARVSALMRRMDSSEYFTKPELDSITSEKGSMISTFKLNLQQNQQNNKAEANNDI